MDTFGNNECLQNFCAYIPSSSNTQEYTFEINKPKGRVMVVEDIIADDSDEEIEISKNSAFEKKSEVKKVPEKGDTKKVRSPKPQNCLHRRRFPGLGLGVHEGSGHGRGDLRHAAAV